MEKHGNAAGPIRNQRMLDHGKPDIVVAFPGGSGTADMVKLSRGRWRSRDPRSFRRREGRMAELRVLDLFSGIGGFSSRFWSAPADSRLPPFARSIPECNRILSKNWPDVRNLQDVCSLGTESLADCGRGRPHLWLPCQDISLAGSGAGLSGSRSGLFWEAIRALRLVRPRYVVMRKTWRRSSDGVYPTFSGR